MRIYEMSADGTPRRQPLDMNEVGRAIIARREFIAAMMTGKVLALARPEPVYPQPNNGQILPAEYYGEQGEQ